MNHVSQLFYMKKDAAYVCVCVFVCTCSYERVLGHLRKWVGVDMHTYVCVGVCVLCTVG